MGSRFEVSFWGKPYTYGDPMLYHSYWRGSDFDEALKKFAECKEQGYNLVKLEWRGH